MNKKTEEKQKSKFYKFEELTWKQIEGLDRKKTVVFLPISPLEEHGPHLPVGTDLLTAKDTCSDAIKELVKKKKDYNFVLFPPIPLGYCDFNTDFPGSFSVKGKVIRDIVYGIGSSLALHGFKYLVICTYHMALIHLKGIYQAKNKLESKYNIKVIEPWSPYFHSKQIEKNEPKLGFDTSKEIHGGFRETSLMKYQYPYLVDSDYKKLQSIYRDMNSPKVLGKKFKELGLKDGYIGSPNRADADYGRWFFNETVKVYVNSTLDLLSGKESPDLPKDVKKIMKAMFWH